MDNAKEYIKMCDCAALQKHRPLPKTSADRNRWHFKRKKLRAYDVKLGWPKAMEKLLKDAIWLPSQDKIQRMLVKDYKSNLDMLTHFHWLITIDQPMKPGKLSVFSMEQLWLIFYMWEKHRKFWKGKKWIE